MPRRPVTTETEKTLVEKVVENRAAIAKFKSLPPVPVKGVGTAADLAREVEAVPTIFSLVDYRIGVGGFPISRLTTIQGPSNHGKTTYLIGLLRSFLERGHYAYFGDIERTTPKTYLRQLMGAQFENRAFNMPEKIGKYSDVRENVRQWCEGIAVLRDKGDISPDTTGIVAIDSLANLLPDNMFEELAKTSNPDRKGKKETGPDGLKGRGGQIQALWNTGWFRELTSVLADTRCAFTCIVRENVTEGEGFFADDVIEPVGGKEVKYGPSLRIRVVADPLYEGDGKDKEMVGERHTVQIVKTKISGKEEKIPEAFFYTSNGKLCPFGFDRARDVLDLGLETGVIESRGAFYYAVGRSEHKLGQGKSQALESLRKDEAILENVIALAQVKRKSA